MPCPRPQPSPSTQWSLPSFHFAAPFWTLASEPDHAGQGCSGFSSAEEEGQRRGRGPEQTTLGHPPSWCIEFSFPITEHLLLSFLSTSGVHHTRQSHTLRKLTVATGTQRGAHTGSKGQRGRPTGGRAFPAAEPSGLICSEPPGTNQLLLDLLPDRPALTAAGVTGVGRGGCGRGRRTGETCRSPLAHRTRSSRRADTGRGRERSSLAQASLPAHMDSPCSFIQGRPAKQGFSTNLRLRVRQGGNTTDDTGELCR